MLSRYKIVTVIVLVAGMVLVAGCSKSPKDIDASHITGQTEVGKVGDLPLTVADVANEYINLSRPNSREKATPERAYEEAMYRKMASIKARSFDDYDRAEVHRLVKNRLHDVVVDYMFNDLFAGRHTVTEKEIDSIYNANLDYYTTPERRVVTHVLSSDNPKAWSSLEGTKQINDVKAVDSMAEARAWHLYDLIKQGSDIAVLAKEYSHDTQSKNKNGKVGPFARTDMVDKFSDVAFKMKVGEISKPFKTVYGWHIIRLDSILPGSVQKLDLQLYDGIRSQLERQREAEDIQAFIDSVVAQAKFEWNDKILDADVGAYDPYDWVCIVNGTDSIPANVLKEHEMMYRVRNRTSDVTPEIRKAIILNMAKPYVVSAAARSMGYFDTDTIKTAYQNLKHAELMNRILRKRIPSKQDWTEDEKQAFYKEHIDQFMAKKPVRFKQIFTHDKETIDKALARLKAGDDFDAVAAALGEGSTDDNPDNKATAVEPGWVSEKDIPKELFDRAWVTNVGNVSAPIKTKYGYHIVKVLEKRPRLPYVSAGTALMRAMREDAYKTTDAQWRKWVSEGVDTERYDKIFAKIDFNNPWKYVTPTSTPPEEQPDTLQISKSDTLAAGGSN